MLIRPGSYCDGHAPMAKVASLSDCLKAHGREVLSELEILRRMSCVLKEVLEVAQLEWLDVVMGTRPSSSERQTAIDRALSPQREHFLDLTHEDRC